MNCRRAREIVFLYTDNEMDLQLLVDFREHLVLCHHCAREIDFTRRMLALFRTRCARAAAPERLRTRILTSLPHRRLP